jgi:hypothetical protein
MRSVFLAAQRTPACAASGGVGITAAFSVFQELAAAV